MGKIAGVLVILSVAYVNTVSAGSAGAGGSAVTTSLGLQQNLAIPMISQSTKNMTTYRMALTDSENIDYQGHVTNQVVEMSLPLSAEYSFDVIRSYGKPSTDHGNTFGDWQMEMPTIVLNDPGAGRSCSDPKNLGNVKWTANYIDYFVYYTSGGTLLSNGRGDYAFDGTYKPLPEYIPRPFLGITLYIPGQQSRKLIFNSFPNISAKYSTVDNWKAECITGQDGFIVTSPKGIKYYFTETSVQTKPVEDVKYKATITCDPWNYPDAIYYSFISCHIDSRYAPNFKDTYGTASLDSNFIRLRNWHVSKIEDRNGKAMTFSYVQHPNGSKDIKTITLPNSVPSYWLPGDPKLPGVYFDPFDINFVYINNLLTSIDAGKYGNIQYQYANGKLIAAPASDRDGEWRYVYKTYPYNQSKLQKIITPFGGIIEYDYWSQVKVVGVGDNFVKSRIVYDRPSDLSTFNISTTCSENCSFTNGELIGKWDFDISFDASLANVTFSMVDPGNVKTVVNSYSYPQYNPTNMFAGKIKSVTLDDLSTNIRLKSESYAWKALAKRGDSGLFKDNKHIVSDDYPVVIDSINRTADTILGSTVVNNYDIFGNPTEITETGSENVADLRHIGISYFSSAAPYEVGLISSVTEKTANQPVSFKGYNPGSGQYYSGKPYMSRDNGVATYYGYHSAGQDIGETWYSMTKGVITYYSEYARSVPRTVTIGGHSYLNYLDDLGRITKTMQGAKYTKTKSYKKLSSLPTYVGELPGYATNYTYNKQYTLSSTTGSWIYTPKVILQEHDGIGRVIANYEKNSNTLDTANYLRKRSITYNAFNDVVFKSIARTMSETDMEGAGEYTYYDNYGRAIQKRFYNPNMANDPPYIQYVHNGLKTDIIDQNGNTTTIDYKTYGEPLNRIPKKITTSPNEDGQASNYSIQSDSLGRLNWIEELNSGAKTSYGYFAGTRMLTSVKHSDLHLETTYQYYGNGILKSKTNYDSNSNMTEVIGYTFDGQGLLSRVTYPDSTYKDFHYDDLNRIAQIDGTALNTVNTYSYQQYRGYLEYETLQSPYGIFKIREDRDWGGSMELTRYTYPSGQVVDYAPSALGLPQQAMPYVSNVTYYGSNSVHTMNYTNGTNITMNLNKATARPNDRGINLINYAYAETLGFDDAGNLTDYSADGENIVNTFDAQNRLTSSSSNTAGQVTYKYNTANKLNFINDNGNTTMIAGNARDVTSITENFILSPLSIVEMGRLKTPINATTKNTMHLNYKLDLLTSAEFDRSGVAGTFRNEYDYDGNNKLHVTKTIAPNGSVEKTIVSMYSSDGKKLIEFSPDLEGFYYKEFYYLNGDLIASRKFNNLATTDTDNDGIMDSEELKAGTLVLPQYQP